MADTPQERVRGEDLVTMERLKKRDMTIKLDAAGYISRASVDDTSILNKLHDRRILAWKHVEAAATYVMWQYAFQKPFHAEPRKAYMLEIAGGQSHGNHAEDCYRKLVRILPKDEQYYVEAAITFDWCDGAEAMTVRIAEAFERLARAVRRVVEGETAPS